MIGHHRLIITPFANGEVRKRVARFYRGRVLGYPANASLTGCDRLLGLSTVDPVKRSHYYSALGRLR